MTPTTLNIIGLVSNILGTIILAFSLSGYISSLRLAVDAHELFIISLNHPTKPIVQVTGTNVHMNRDKKKSTIFSWFGVLFIVLGFVFQLLSYLI